MYKRLQPWLGVLYGSCVVAVFLGVGCISRDVDEPLRMITGRIGSREEVERAIERARRLRGIDERWLHTMDKLAWGGRVPAWLRIHAIDELLLYDETAFRQAISRQLDLIDDWEMLGHACGLIGDRGWKEMTPALVRSFVRHSRGVVDLDRPERIALERLYPGDTVEAVLTKLVIGAGGTLYERDRVLALELYGRLVGRDGVERLIRSSGCSSGLLGDLSACVDGVGVVPMDRYQVAWLKVLRSDLSVEGVWRKSIGVIAEMSEVQRKGVGLRHLPVVSRLVESGRSVGRGQITEELIGMLRGRSSYIRDDLVGWAAHGYEVKRDVVCVVRKLGWLDLQVVKRLLRGLSDPRLRASLFQQADADHEDRSTEYGGVLVDDGGALVARPYAPVVRRHDRRFYASDEMIREMYYGVAHYHFHAQVYRNGRFAGPGLGDVRFADRMGASCVVFTFVDRDRLNVDYYQPGGVVLDLGVIVRPQ